MNHQRSAGGKPNRHMVIGDIVPVMNRIFWLAWPCIQQPDTVREMVLGDIVPPFAWAYTGHVFPNGEAYRGAGMPPWRSNDTCWHGI